MKTNEIKSRYRFSITENLPNFISYYYQLKLVPNNAKKILEIGIGNKFISSQLKSIGKSITTLDIDKNLSPDVIASVTDTTLKSNSFDCVLCYEVLEHLPLDEFKTALNEIKRITKKYAIISLPFSGFCFSIYSKLPFSEGKIFRIPLPFFKRPKNIVKKLKLNHLWAVGEHSASKKEIRKKIKNAGFKILNEVSPVLNVHHLFWVLEKND